MAEADSAEAWSEDLRSTWPKAALYCLWSIDAAGTPPDDPLRVAVGEVHQAAGGADV